MLLLKWQNKQVRSEIWSSDCEDITVVTKDYSNVKKAYKIFTMMIGKAILGGWQILNVFPQKETWETKRSK